MAHCIDPDGYGDGLDLRTDRALSLFRILRSCRGRELGGADRILDLGCGPRSAFGKFWALVFRKIGLDEGDRPEVVGIDLEDPDDEGSLPEGLEYIQGDVNDWNPGAGWSGSFSIVTSIYSWHWILGRHSSLPPDVRADALYSKTERLLADGGHLAVQHLYTHDTMPEISLIALEALRRSGIDKVSGITVDEYRARRAEAWRVPNALKQVCEPFETFKKRTYGTKLQSAIVSGSRSWHWKNAESIWTFWRTVNLPAVFSDFDVREKSILEKAFAAVLKKDSLADLGVPTLLSPSGTLYVRITVHAAHEIIAKLSNDVELTNTVLLQPDLPNRVRSRLASKMTILEESDPWFGGKGIRLYGARDDCDDDLTCAVDHVLEPILFCAPRAMARVYSINLRQIAASEGGTIGHMANICAHEDDHEWVERDAKCLESLKRTGGATVSEAIFGERDNPDDIVVFSGEPWGNHIDWQRLNAFSPTSSTPSAFALWLSGKGCLSEKEEDGDDVVFADYLWEARGWRMRGDVFPFFRFLLQQLRKDSRSCLIITSNRAVEGDLDSLDSASITFFQNAAPFDACSKFPGVADCYLVIDALQELALVRERMNSRRTGTKRMISASSHEQRQVVDFIFSGLLQQGIDRWFRVSSAAGRTDDWRLGEVMVDPVNLELLKKIRIVPSAKMLQAAMGFYMLWSGCRGALDEWFYGDKDAVPLKEALGVWLPEMAVGIAALTAVRTSALESAKDFREIEGKWGDIESQIKKQILFEDINIDPYEMVKTDPGLVELRDKQVWFLRAGMAALLNACKNSPRQTRIKLACKITTDGKEVFFQVLNQRADLRTNATKTEGTQAVLALAVEAVSGVDKISPRFGPCDEQGIEKSLQVGTHWLAEARFPIDCSWISIARRKR